MYDEGIWQDVKFIALGVKFNCVRDFVPTKAHETGVVTRDITTNYDVRFEIRVPLDLIFKNEYD